VRITLPLVLCWSEAWSHNVGEGHKIFQNKVIRKMLGPEKDEFSVKF
jgi:hypothetical protein